MESGVESIENPTRKETEPRNNVQKVISLLGEHQAVVIRGDVKTGKTTLAKNTAAIMKEHEGINPQMPVKVYFTTAEIQQTFGAKSAFDKGTNVTYEKVPFYSELQDNPGTNLIIIDEVSSRQPVPGNWSRYIDNPKNKFIILEHPMRPSNKQWEELFRADPGAIVKL